MRLPSIKTLKHAFGEDKAKRLRRVLKGSLVLHTDTVLLALNGVLEGHGVECIRSGECSDDPIVAEYINMGDTYNTTILYDHANDRWKVTSFGDWYEWAERKGIIEPASQEFTVTDKE